MDNTRLEQFETNDVLFREGEKSREMYILRSGTVDVIKNKQGKEIPIAELGVGNFVGEMSFITGLPRSATVVAKEKVVASLISVDVLKKDGYGITEWAISIAQTLAERIRKTTNLIGDYMVQDPGQGSAHIIHQGGEMDFSLDDEKRGKNARIYLKGYFTGKHLNDLNSMIRAYSLNGAHDVIVDFADVLDIDHEVLTFLRSLTSSGGGYDVNITIENIQLIRNKVLTIQGIQHIMTRSRLPQKRVSQGEALIRQGETDSTMYVIKTGRFCAYRRIDDEDILLGYMEAGDVVGELGLIKEGPRSATVEAEKASIVYEIRVDDFYENMYHIPGWFIELIRGLVDRLRLTNDMLERVVRRQFRETEKSTENKPIGIVLDAGKPGKILLQGYFIRGNLEYLSTMVNLLIKRGLLSITIDLNKISRIDYDCIRYLLQLFVYLQKKGGFLNLLGAKKDILYLFSQYEIELPQRQGETG